MTAIQARSTLIPPATTSHLTFARQLRSELIKVATVRSTWWSVIIVAVLTIGISIAITTAVDEQFPNIIMAVVSPVQLTMLLAGILGVISVTGEYSTGMVRSTFTANPVRGSVLVAKAIVLGALMFVVALVTFLIAAVAITPLASARGLVVEWSDPSMAILPILSASAAMALFALLGVGLGFLLRSGAGAIAVTVGILFVLPVILSLVTMLLNGIEWIQNLSLYMPSSAVQNAILPIEGVGLTAGEAWLMLVAWPAIALLGGWAVLRGRDV